MSSARRAAEGRQAGREGLQAGEAAPPSSQDPGRGGKSSGCPPGGRGAAGAGRSRGAREEAPGHLEPIARGAPSRRPGGEERRGRQPAACSGGKRAGSSVRAFPDGELRRRLRPLWEPFAESRSSARSPWPGSPAPGPRFGAARPLARLKAAARRHWRAGGCRATRLI